MSFFLRPIDNYVSLGHVNEVKTKKSNCIPSIESEVKIQKILAKPSSNNILTLSFRVHDV